MNSDLIKPSEADDLKKEDLHRQIHDLQSRLNEAEETLQAIRLGEIDALLVEGETGEQVFTLKGAEHGYRLFVESMHEGAVTLRADGLILYCNTRFASLMEIPLSKVIGTYFHDFVYPEQSDEVRAFLTGTRDRRQEFELKSKADTRIPVVLAIGAGLIEEISGAMCMIVTDIREQKHLEQLLRTQKALEQSQDQLKLALETARLGSWRLDLASGQMECSTQYRANFGLQPHDELTREKLFESIIPEDRDRVRLAIEKCLTQNAIYESEYRILWPDGNLQWIIASGQLIRGQDGNPTHMVGVTLNITDRKKAEDSLRDSENRFRTLAEAIPQLSWTCRADGHCDYLSQQWIDYTGVPEAAQLGYGWLSSLHPDDHTRASEIWAESVRSGKIYDLEYRIRGSDGSYRWFKTRGIPFRNSEQKVERWFGTCTEIEDIVQARHVLSRDKEHLEELIKSRTASLNETTEQLNSFCYSIVHDLKAPLRAQQGYAKVILEEYGDQIGEQGKHYAERIVTAAERLEKLVQDLLSHVGISRQDLPLQKVSLAAVVKQVCSDFNDPIVKTKAEVEVVPIDGFVIAHEASLNLIVANLISNALKYTKPEESPRIKIWSEPQAKNIRLWVEDHGIGIEPEYCEKIFGVFQRLHTPEMYPGTGIGLALVRRGTERMGGNAGVISKLGQGSRFWIELPLNP